MRRQEHVEVQYFSGCRAFAEAYLDGLRRIRRVDDGKERVVGRNSRTGRAAHGVVRIDQYLTETVRVDHDCIRRAGQAERAEAREGDVQGFLRESVHSWI